MAYKRILFIVSTLAICYFVGVTWADTVTTKANNGAVNNNVVVVDPNISINAPLNSVASNLSTTLHTPTISVNKNGTSPAKCVCDGALVPRLAENGKELEICPECKCKHVARNTTLIKVVVIIVIWIISILVIYMLFLMCLDPLLNKRVKANYQEHTNEDDDTASNSAPLPNSTNQELSARANVLNRVGHQQTKWKRQVREQRRRIYDRRNLNC